MNRKPISTPLTSLQCWAYQQLAPVVTYLQAMGSTPVTSHHHYAGGCSYPLYLHEYTSAAQPPVAARMPKIGFDPYHWPALLCIPMASLCNHKRAHWQPRTLQMFVQLKLAPASSIDPSCLFTPLQMPNASSCHHAGTWSQPQQLGMCIPLVSTTTATCPSPSHWAWRCPWGPKEPLQSLRTSCSSHYQGLCKCWCLGHKLPEPMRHHVPSDLEPPHTLYLLSCTIRPRATACSNVSPATD